VNDRYVCKINDYLSIYIECLPVDARETEPGEFAQPLRVGDHVLPVGVSPDPAHVDEQLGLVEKSAIIEAFVLVAKVCADVAGCAVLGIIDDALHDSIAGLDYN
jgi:hypothetical protein